MPVTLRVHVGEKRSPVQYETVSVAADITATDLEISSPDAIRQKLHEMQMIARSAVQSQLLDLMPQAGNANTSPPPRIEHNGTQNGNGRRRSYGRPNPEPTAKQKQLVRKLAAERNIDAESIGTICENLLGIPLRSCTKDDISKLIDALLEEQVS